MTTMRGAATRQQLAASYRLVAELLLYPEERDPAAVEAGRAALADAPAAMREPIERFIRSERSEDVDEYLAVLELSPPCPLYLGAHIFEEPASCRGAACSGRNAYMLELAGVYRHFGFEIGGGELPDFLPAMTEFLALSLEHGERDRIGLRRRLLERYVHPGLAPMREALERYDTPYALLLAALQATVGRDLDDVAQPMRVADDDARAVVDHRAREALP